MASRDMGPDSGSSNGSREENRRRRSSEPAIGSIKEEVRKNISKSESDLTEVRLDANPTLKRRTEGGNENPPKRQRRFDGDTDPGNGSTLIPGGSNTTSYCHIL